MRRLVIGIGLAVLAFFILAPPPAEAACYECRYHGFSCGLFGCVDTWKCNGTGSFCSQCWEVCYENYDMFCTWSTPCQWTRNFTPKDAPQLFPAGQTPLMTPVS